MSIPWNPKPEGQRKQVLEILHDVSADNKIWLALGKVLETAIAQEDEGLYEEGISNDVLNRRVGGKRALLWFQNTLQDMYDEAHDAPDERR